MQEKSLKQNFFIYMLRNIMMMVTPVIIFPYASRVLGVDGVGKVQFAQNTAMYFELIAQFGIKSYAIREGVKVRGDREKFGKLITELFIVNLCTDAVAVFTYMAAVFSLGSLQAYKGLLLVFLLEVIFSGLSFEWFYSILEDYVYITIRTTIFQLMSLIIMLVFAHRETDLYVYAIALALPYVGDSITNILHSRKTVKLFGYKNYNIGKHAKGMFFIFSIILSTSLYTMMDTTMLGLMQGDTATGLYTAASKLNRLCVKLITAICAVFLPRLALYRAKGDSKDFRELAVSVSNIILGISIPACVGMFMLSRETILIFSGEKFLDAVSAMRFMCVDLLFSSLNGFLAWQILAPCNKEKNLFFATVMGAVVDFILNLILIPPFGTAGAASATVLAEIVVFSLCSWASKEFIPLLEIWRYVWQYAAASVPIIIICLLARKYITGTIYIMGISVALSVAAYAGMLYWLNNIYARKYVKDILRFLYGLKGENRDDK